MNTYWISLPCDLLSSLASFQCSLLHHLHLSSDLGLSKYVNQHSHLNLSRNVRLSVLYDLDFNNTKFTQKSNRQLYQELWSASTNLNPPFQALCPLQKNNLQSASIAVLWCSWTTQATSRTSTCTST